MKLIFKLLFLTLCYTSFCNVQGEYEYKVEILENDTVHIESEKLIHQVTIIDQNKKVYYKECFLGTNSEEDFSILTIEHGEYFIIIETVEGYKFQKFVIM